MADESDLLKKRSERKPAKASLKSESHEKQSLAGMQENARRTQ
jgi:hypothetical protein